ncbi:MAG TPA: aa3-type cytochrome c oxidase subunit IV [Micavibrio sp.]|nr:aa3-type cytochrome c oxidase subunit IV [Pseudomonadota bacterium]MEC8664520.1 aa3-type cytochrome c oxidase subunit IV [Pseudomonadota bacterium]HIF24788.1 aa3-type cytochrome c oxidase subunit IV [Micavibrio sp.]HIL29029.1 aa3-type cytochrome c oxidase subunit IV [Micavibrio sp.]
MANQQTPKVTKAEVQESQALWEGFTALMKYSIYSVVGILVLMAIFLL